MREGPPQALWRLHAAQAIIEDAHHLQPVQPRRRFHLRRVGGAVAHHSHWQPGREGDDLVGGPVAGLVSYVEQVAAASALPVIIYHRGNAQFTADAMRQLARNPKVIGFKDGTGDVSLAQEIVLAVGETKRDFLFFNGLLTAELSQGAYRGIGIPLYSSAAFAMAPAVARGYYDAYVAHDEPRRLRFLREFYQPLVRLRDQTPGFGVSLIKAGLRLSGLPVGSVRAPLVDPTPAQEIELARILAAGHRLVEELASARLVGESTR